MILFQTIFINASSRFIFEPFILLSVYLANNCKFEIEGFKRSIIILALWLQAVVFVSASVTLLYTLLPGSIYGNGRTNVMQLHTNGYLESGWVDNLIPADALVLTESRFMGLERYRSMSLSWDHFYNSGENADQYLSDILKVRPQYMLAHQNLSHNNFRGCIDENSEKTFVIRRLTRSPVIGDALQYAYLYKFLPEKLPGCYKKIDFN
jgi:hypothetical protein